LETKHKKDSLALMNKHQMIKDDLMQRGLLLNDFKFVIIYSSSSL